MLLSIGLKTIYLLTHLKPEKVSKGSSEDVVTTKVENLDSFVNDVVLDSDNKRWTFKNSLNIL